MCFCYSVAAMSPSNFEAVCKKLGSKILCRGKDHGKITSEPRDVPDGPFLKILKFNAPNQPTLSTISSPKVHNGGHLCNS